MNDKQTEQRKTTDYKYPPDYMFVCFTYNESGLGLSKETKPHSKELCFVLNVFNWIWKFLSYTCHKHIYIEVRMVEVEWATIIVWDDGVYHNRGRVRVVLAAQSGTFHISP